MQPIFRPKLIVHALVVALTAIPGFATQQPETDSSTVLRGPVLARVTLLVTVRDKHGQIVRDLTKDDFILQDDGKLQTIKFFSKEADLPLNPDHFPLTLGVLVDTSWSQREVLDQERNASHSFLDQMLVKEKYKAFLIHFDREVELLQDLTSHHEKLESALDLLKTADRERSNDSNSNDPNSSSGSDSRHEHHGGTQLYDAVYLASNELMKKQAGRKAVIVLSDGVDRGSKTSLESAIAAAQRSDTVVYAIYFKGEEERGERGGSDNGRGGRAGGGGGWPGGGGGWPGGGGGGYPGGGSGKRGGEQRPEEPRVDGKKILARISKETGGRFFEATKKQTVGDIYTSIAEELRTQYSLGYTPERDHSSTGYHHVQLQVKKKDMTVQTRDGYYDDSEN